MTVDHDQAPDDARRVARDALISSVVSNVGMFAVIIALNVAVAKRDVIKQHWQRARAIVGYRPGAARESREVAEFARDVADISHAGVISEP